MKEVLGQARDPKRVRLEGMETTWRVPINVVREDDNVLGEVRFRILEYAKDITHETADVETVVSQTRGVFEKWLIRMADKIKLGNWLRHKIPTTTVSVDVPIKRILIARVNLWDGQVKGGNRRAVELLLLPAEDFECGARDAIMFCEIVRNAFMSGDVGKIVRVAEQFFGKEKAK